ncbi:serine/threonine-protein kinase Nek1-like isoform X1 [Argiope bruennichi]|uniref:serine/threonine-protein kinase Nek1-like isoform X1 n=2 Tax=Argiope bruennichi TaxID=94029 RepID=UPI0024949D2F|nr:serine/threonine-protein kinase Nek1-like isoform X1 [Argiope bruennichi]
MESYQFIKQIRQCNYGDVWLVKCFKTRKKYVLKRIDLHRASKRDQRAAYLEAKFLSTLKHPNIVTYLDSFYNSKGNLFIVMGYCECGDFHSFIKNRNGAYFEEKEIVNWFIQICMGLKYLHDKGILHRDLKTQNIFVTKNKIIKIGDLGIAQVLKTADEMATNFIRAPYYMNPEVFNGKDYNQKTDVWALGCCMYEIAALESAFVAQDMHTFMKKVVKGKIPSIPAIYSSEFFKIISSMLNPDPDKRPSITELLLNEFVRKFIILSLNELPPTLNSSSRACSRSTPSLADGHRPLSRLFDAGNNNSTQKVCKIKGNLTNAATIRTVPDSNGNGDGNDNSQYHANHIPVLNANKNSESKISISNSNIKGANGNVVVKKQIADHHCDLKENNQSEIISVTSSNSSRSTPNSNIQKLRNEKSFTLLNNLCYTIRQSRLQNWQDTRNEFFPALPKVKHSYGDSPPKSAEELYFHSNRNELLKRCSLSAFEIHSHKRFENTDKLPQITADELQMSSLSAVVVDKINLPILENSNLPSHNNNNDDDGETIPWECTTKDDHFDRLLIQNIMECNDAKQDGFAKSTGHQLRREILKLNEISNSTSIV